ncbi:MAG: CPBP family intramembrane metalloprotease [Candidatus Eremiobacteraeota bacterium]|nr:CPBP family intramembrane metalloprotease [Candidatus Eremiobacteraeota bacterium]MCW5868211.1 CPBP family intramembrane metalloprotease [Candidatus Eremiobacteraeota bacterium]
MNAAGKLILGLLGLWVTCWLSLGLLWGQPLLLLHPLEAPEFLRVIYLLMLYGGLVALLHWRWRVQPPCISWGRLSSALRAGLLGLVFIGLQRICLGGAWHPEKPTTAAWFSALLLSFPIAAVEEAVFRGYLYGSLRHTMRPLPAALLISSFFALVHLFRPGDLEFKLAYGFGLLLAALVLTLLAERAGLWSAAALHATWIIAAVLDPPGHVEPGLWTGLRGEMAAGLCSWMWLVILAGAAGLRSDRQEPYSGKPKQKEVDKGSAHCNRGRCTPNEKD